MARRRGPDFLWIAQLLGEWKRDATGCPSLPMHTDLRTRQKAFSRQPPTLPHSAIRSSGNDQDVEALRFVPTVAIVGPLPEPVLSAIAEDFQPPWPRCFPPRRRVLPPVCTLLLDFDSEFVSDQGSYRMLRILRCRVSTPLHPWYKSESRPKTLTTCAKSSRFFASRSSSFASATRMSRNIIFLLARSRRRRTTRGMISRLPRRTEPPAGRAGVNSNETSSIHQASVPILSESST
jgi:hypothetical protein